MPGLSSTAKTTAGTITGAEVVRLREVLVAHSSEQLAQVVMHTLIRVHIGVSEDRVEVLETLDKLLEMEEACGTNVIVERAEWMSFIDRDLTGEDHLAMWSEALDSCTGNDGQRPKAMARVIHGLVGLGRFQQARAHLDEFFEMLPEPVSSKWWYIVGRLAAQLNDLEGRWTEAERFYRAIADRGSFDDCLRLGLAGIASLAVRTGDRARLEEVMAEVDALPPAPGRGVIGYRERLVPDIVAAYACADSHPARAVDLLRPALQAMASGDEIRPAEDVVVLVARLVRRGLGSAGELSDLVAQAAIAQFNDGPLEDAYRAEVEASIRPSLQETMSIWQAVVDGWDALSVPFRAAESRLVLAEEQLRVEDRERARETLAQALKQALALGAEPLANEVRALAGRARLRLDGESTATGTGGLTSRELEVLGLLEKGSTNHEIGRALFMSPRTASVHVSHILAKLGANNRTEAGAVARERGLL